MFNLPKPHGEKLAALLNNDKLPTTEKPRVEHAIEYYNQWLETLKNISGDLKILPELVQHREERKIEIIL